MLTELAHKAMLHGKARLNAVLGKPIEFKHAGRKFWMNADRSAPYAITASLPKLANMIDQIADTPNAIFDVGANCGIFSALAVDRFPTTRVVCFEPSNEVRRLIKRNCAGHHIDVFNCAIGDVDGETRTLFVNTRSQQTNSFIRQAAELFARPDDVESIMVECRTLDSVCQELEIDCVDVLKIDVQGWEGQVLKGASTLLPRVRYLFIESSWMDVSSIVHLVPFALHYGFTYATVLNSVHLGADVLLTRNKINAGSNLQFTLSANLLEQGWY